MSKYSRNARRERRREGQRVGSAVNEALQTRASQEPSSAPPAAEPAPPETKVAPPPAPAAPSPEPLAWPEVPQAAPPAPHPATPARDPGRRHTTRRPRPKSEVRRTAPPVAGTPKASPATALSEGAQSAPESKGPDATVPAAHLTALRAADALAPPSNEATTARTRKDDVKPKYSKAPVPAAPGSSPRVNESRPKPASRVQERAPEAKASPPPKPAPAPSPKPVAPTPPARAEESSGTLSGFVSATRQLLKRFTGAPPEVRIALPSGDLKLFKLSGDLDERVALQAATWVLFVQAMKADADLTIAIDCTGGSLNAGLSLIDVLLNAKCRVRTHCVRQALGIGSMVLAAGNKGFRTVARTAILSAPVALKGADGKIYSPANPKALQAFSAATGRTPAQVEKEILPLKAITAKLAVRHGLADAVAV